MRQNLKIVNLMKLGEVCNADKNVRMIVAIFEEFTENIIIT